MSASLNVIVNGEARRTSSTTVASLVRELEFDPAKVAVERNGAIAPRSTLETVALADGDVLEIVHFVGGGDFTSPLPLREKVGRGGRRASGGCAADPSPSAPDGAPPSPTGGEGK